MSSSVIFEDFSHYNKDVDVALYRRQFGVVIPSFDSGKLLEACVNSIKTSAKRANLDVVIVVVDCHPESLDQSIKFQVDQYSTLTKNPGFGSGANFGLQKLLQFEYVNKILLVNPDAELQIDFFEVLLKNPEILIKLNPISPKILFSSQRYKLEISDFKNKTNHEVYTILADNDFELFNSHGVRKAIREVNFKIDHDDILVFSSTSKIYDYLSEDDRIEANIINNAGSFYRWPDIAGDLGFNELDVGQFDGNITTRISWCGAAVILDRRYIEKLTGFDERFFLYYEDTEFALRGTRIGLPPLFMPNLVVRHQHSASTGQNQNQRAKWIWESRALFAITQIGLISTLLLLCGRFILGIKRKNERSLIGVLKGYLITELLFSFRGLYRFYALNSKKKK